MFGSGQNQEEIISANLDALLSCLSLVPLFKILTELTKKKQPFEVNAARVISTSGETGDDCSNFCGVALKGKII